MANTSPHREEISPVVRALGNDIRQGVMSVSDALGAPGRALRGDYSEIQINPDYSVNPFSDSLLGQAANMAGVVTLGSAPVPRPYNALSMGASVHVNADALVNALREHGINVPPPRNSVNRHGQYSSYIDSPLGEIRLSDHSSNENFSTSALRLYDYVNFDVQAEATRIADLVSQARADRSLRQAQQQQAVAPYAQRYATASSDEARNLVLREFIESGVAGDRRWGEMSRDDRNALRRRLIAASS